MAYAKVCAPYHTWAVRTAVSAGMCALPTRDQLLMKLNETGKFTFVTLLHNLLFIVALSIKLKIFVYNCHSKLGYDILVFQHYRECKITKRYFCDQHNSCGKH